MKVDRIRKVENKNQLENVVDDYVTLGYKVSSRGENTVRLIEEKGWGSFGAHIITFLLTVWWTLGIGNLIYALAKHYMSREVIMVKVKKEVIK